MNNIDFNAFFQQLSSTESIIFFAFCIGAFLFGILVGIALRGRAIRRLRKELKKKNEEVTTLEEKLKEQEEAIALKDADLKKSAYDLNQVRLAADRYEQEKNELNRELYQLKSQLEQGVGTGNGDEALQQQIIALQARNEELQQRIQNEGANGNEAQLKALQQQITYLKNRNEELQEEAENKEANGEGEEVTNNARIRALEQQIAYLKSQNAELMERLAKEKDAETKTITSGLPEDRLAAFEARLAQLENENDELRISLNSIQKDREVVTDKAPIFPAEPEEGFDEPPMEQIIKPEVDLFRTDRALLRDQSKDDLSRIDGVGPFLEKKLNDIGVYSFEQIANWSPEDISKVTKDIQYFEGRIEKDNWVGQAKILMDAPAEEEKPATRSAGEFSGPAQEDDLKVIEGIGPKIEAILKNAGIDTLEELAKSDPADISLILEQADSHFQMHDPTSWPAQARLAANGDWDVLEDYQDSLRGGRDID